MSQPKDLFTTSPSLSQLDAKSIWHPYTPLPFRGPKAIFTRAEGAYVYDEQGKKYFDATSSWWCNLHGHCHPRLVEALYRQAQTLDQIMFAPHSHPIAIELATRLLQTLGAPFEKIFYSDDGSTAVETALKIAVQYWYNRGEKSRHRFLCLDGAYHGDTVGAISVSQVSEFHSPFAKIRLPTIPLPVPRTEEDVQHAEEIILGHEKEIACLILEPLVMGAHGMQMYPPAPLESLLRVCRKRNIPIIFDEVFTGFGRTGEMFAFEHLKVRPDMICLSKGLTSGMLPLAVTAVTGAIFEEFLGSDEKAFYHGHTYSGNALGCAVAVESLKVFSENQCLERNRALAGVMASFTSEFQALPHVKEVRQLGMIWAMDLCLDKKTGTIPEPPNGPGWKIAEALWDAGLWIRPLGNVIYCIPPYCSRESELQTLFTKLYSEVKDEKHYNTAVPST